MNLSKLVPIALCGVLVACNPSTPDAQAPATEAAAPADAASETVAVYGDEAPVAIEAPKPEGDHAHNADGSHAEGEDHPHDAEGGHPAEDADAGHAHAPGQEAHDH